MTRPAASSCLFPIMFVFVLAAVGLVGAAVPALGHEFWLAPSRYRATLGDSVRIAAFVGTGFRGEARPFAAPRVERFVSIGPRPADLAPTAENGALVWSRFRMPDDLGLLVAYASNFTTIELPGPEFERYLKLEGLDNVANARRKAGARDSVGRERYRRVCKTWIGGPRTHNEVHRRATTALGLPLEIVPHSIPGGDARLVVEVRADGKPLQGALVRVWRQPLYSAGIDAAPHDAAKRDSVRAIGAARTDKRGLVTVKLDEPGEYLVSTVHMIPSQDLEAANWESTWASLTFVRPPR